MLHFLCGKYWNWPRKTNDLNTCCEKCHKSVIKHDLWYLFNISKWSSNLFHSWKWLKYCLLDIKLQSINQVVIILDLYIQNDYKHCLNHITITIWYLPFPQPFDWLKDLVLSQIQIHHQLSVLLPLPVLTFLHILDKYPLVLKFCWHKHMSTQENKEIDFKSISDMAND